MAKDSGCFLLKLYYNMRDKQTVSGRPITTLSRADEW